MFPSLISNNAFNCEYNVYMLWPTSPIGIVGKYERIDCILFLIYLILEFSGFIWDLPFLEKCANMHLKMYI